MIDKPTLPHLTVARNNKYALCSPHGDLFGGFDYCDAHQSSGGISLASKTGRDLFIINPAESSVKLADGFSQVSRMVSKGVFVAKSDRRNDLNYTFVGINGVQRNDQLFALARNFDQYGASVQVKSRTSDWQRVNLDGEFFGDSFPSIGYYRADSKHTGARVTGRDFTIINENAVSATPERFKFVGTECDGLIPVAFTNETVGWLDDRLDKVLEIPGLYIADHFADQTIPISLDGDKWGLMSTEGRWILEPAFDELYSIGEGMYVICENHEQIQSRRIVNTCGNQLSDFRVGLVSEFVDGYAEVTDDSGDSVNAFNYIDRNCSLVFGEWSKVAF
jgi:hypothetical protein